MLAEGRHARLVAAHPVERLRDDDLERPSPRILQQPLDAGAQDHAVSRYGRVAVGARDLPALALDRLAADLELVLDGSGSLLVGRIAGIERTAGVLVQGLLSAVRLLLRHVVVCGNAGNSRPFLSLRIASAFTDSVTLEGRFEPNGKRCEIVNQEISCIESNTCLHLAPTGRAWLR